MEIRKTSLSIPDLPQPVRPRVAEHTSVNSAEDTRSKAVSRVHDRYGDSNFAGEQRESALQRLEETRRTQVDIESPKRARMQYDHATRKALDAYQAQQTQAQSDERATLSHLLGIDYYA